MRRISMPPTVKVGSHIFQIIRPRIVKNEAGDKINGYCHVDGLKIAIQKGLKVSKQQEFLLHELCHTATDDTNVPIEHEEEIITMVAKGLLQILKDNPEMVKFLTQS